MTSKSYVVSVLRPLWRLIVLILATLSGSAFAAEYVAIPGESPGPPFYMRSLLDPEHEWVGNIFYREPACVPLAFNLLRLFDIPDAFRCELVVEGFEVRNAPVGPPIHTELQGLGAVPIWFVRKTDFEAAIADGTLTIAELATLGSLIMGHADFYQEVLHPRDGAQVVNADFLGEGIVEDGRSFRFHVQDHDGRFVHFQVVFE
jgi:hypothetical protein